MHWKLWKDTQETNKSDYLHFGERMGSRRMKNRIGCKNKSNENI